MTPSNIKKNTGRVSDHCGEWSSPKTLRKFWLLGPSAVCNIFGLFFNLFNSVEENNSMSKLKRTGLSTIGTIFAQSRFIAIQSSTMF